MEKNTGIKTVACISFTANGSQINRKLKDWLEEQGISCKSRALRRYAAQAGLLPLESNLREWCAKHFFQEDALIFIGAAGIAVRGIAPFVTDKKTDPAVLVIDEQGNFVISLLSGHLGGANELTGKIADFLKAMPVITTGTDVNHTFAVDVFAKKNHLLLDSMQSAKEIAAALIDRKEVFFWSELPVTGEIPSGLKVVTQNEPEKQQDAFCQPKEPISVIAVTVHEEETWKKNWIVPQNGETECVFSKVYFSDRISKYSFRISKDSISLLRLIPKIVHLGIGCRKKTPKEQIILQVEKVMKQCGLDWRAVASVASIDLKQNEIGLLEFCQAYQLPFHVYSAAQLQEVEGNFTPSSFVGTITGVDNVCERAAALDCIKQSRKEERTEEQKEESETILAVETRNGETVASRKQRGYQIIQKKVAENGVTVAIAIEDRSVRFE